MDGQSQGIFILGERDAIAAVNRSRQFVARETELSYLEKGLEQLRRNEFSSFLIFGQSGMGKTQIVRQFSGTASKQNCCFLPSKCNPFTPHQPYSILRHIVCEFIAAINHDSDSQKHEFRKTLNRDLAENSGIICQTIPELKEFFDQVGIVDRVEPEKESNRIVHVHLGLLISLCKFRPLVIFIDDIQWIDLITFEICRKVIAEKPPVMIIYNYRTEDADNDLFVFGQNLQDIGIGRLIHITAFSPWETRELVTSRFNELRGCNDLIGMLHTKMDGNPFVLAEQSAIW